MELNKGILNHELAVKLGVEAAKPTILEYLRMAGMSSSGSQIIAIEVRHPNLTENYCTTVGFEDSLIGHPKGATVEDYKMIANNKGNISENTGMPSGDVVRDAPWLLEPGNVLFQGSYTEGTGLYVNISGVSAPMDQALGKIIHSSIEASYKLAILVLQSQDVQILEAPEPKNE